MTAGDDPRQMTGTLTIDELVERWPAVARVFVRRRMHCVGCDIARFETVADACRIYGQPLEAVLAELRATARTPTGAGMEDGQAGT